MRLDLTKITEIDWARLAAFIDGEGCIGICEGKRVGKTHLSNPARFRLQVELANTDPRLIVWLKETFGGSACARPDDLKHENWRRCFVWVITDAYAEKILRGCQPYFVIKRDQADLALAFRKTITLGGKPVNDEITEIRRMYASDLKALKRISWKEIPYSSVESQMIN